MFQPTWASRFGFSLSQADRELLETKFRIQNPLALPNLRQDVPKDVTIEDVEFAYEVLASPRNRQLWVRCCECGRKSNHRRGLVLRFADGTRATLGRNCGKTKHKLDHDERIKEFEARVERARLLEQAFAMLAQAPIIHEHLVRISSDPTLAACEDAKRKMLKDLPDFTRRLERADGGRLVELVSVRDWEAERQRDARLDRKLEVRARHSGRDRDQRGGDAALLAELQAEGVRDAAKSALFKREERELHAFAGHGVFTVLPRSGPQCYLLKAELSDAFRDFKGRSTADLTNQKLLGARKKFFGVLDKAIALTDALEAATRFFLPGNVEGMVRAVNGLWAEGDARRAAVRDGVLYMESAPKVPLVDTKLPPLGLNTIPLTRAREAILDAHSEVDRAA